MRFNRIVLLLALLSGIWLGAVPTQAQDAADVAQSPILMLDQEILFTSSLFGKRTIQEIEAETDALVAENRRIEADLTAEERKLTDMRSTMDTTAFRKLADEFDTKVQGIRRAQDAKSRELGRMRDQARQVFYSRALPVLGELVRERGAVAILDRRSIFVASERIDITDEAVARIDQVIGDGSTLAPAPETPE